MTMKLSVSESMLGDLRVAVQYGERVEFILLAVPRLTDAADIHQAYARVLGRLLQEELDKHS